MLPSEYLLLEQVQASQTESKDKTICQSTKYDCSIMNHRFIGNCKSQTFVLSRMTKRRVVFRGLNNRIMTYKSNNDQVIKPVG